jgi:hypothetical protein
MEQIEAEILVRNFVARLQPTGECFVVPGDTLSAPEVAALKKLARWVDANSSTASSAVPAVAVDLNTECLTAPADDAAMLCIDFGTAYSKASIWRDGSSVPTPLDLRAGSEPSSTGLLMESAAYISGEHIYFGAKAVEQYRHEEAPDRKLFGSPKEFLTHDAGRIDIDRPDAATDPTRLFSSRDILTLYLGFLTAIACEVLPKGISRAVTRRYAAPGWDDVQADTYSAKMGAAARSLGDLLVDAQILADTLPISEWRAGLDVHLASSAMRAIRASRLSRSTAPVAFIERTVLEAVAAAAGIQDRFKNRRPQVLVVDVGAGTTDIGLFKYVVRRDSDALVAPYAGGMRAIRMAGNLVDDALTELAASKLKLPAESLSVRMFKRRLKDRVESVKAILCSDGAVEIELPEVPRVEVELAELIATPAISHFIDNFRKTVTAALNCSPASFRSLRDDNIVVFSGGGRSIPFLREVFRDPIMLTEGPAYFQLDDAVPDWVGTTVPDVTPIFPQIAVATGGCSPVLPAEGHVIRSDTGSSGPRSLAPIYKGS